MISSYGTDTDSVCRNADVICRTLDVTGGTETLQGIIAVCRDRLGLN
jgi:hypothetical protein